MKIKKPNPSFQRFEASEDDFNKEFVEDSRNFLINLLKEDEEVLQTLQETYSNFYELISYAVKTVLCYDMKIMPDCIKIHYQDEDCNSIGSKTLMSWGQVSRNGHQDGVFGYVMIYPYILEKRNIVMFISSLLHEFRHIYQDVQKERGHLVVPVVNLKKEPDNAMDNFWLFLKYCASISEFDAEMFSASEMDKWLKESNAKTSLPKEVYNKRKSFINKKYALSTLTFVLGNFNKIGGGIIMSPYLVPKAFVDCARYRLPESSNFDNCDENNIINDKLGYRTKEKAQKYLRKMRRKLDYSEREKLRIIDSMLVVFASKHNIPAKDFGLLRYSPEYKTNLEFIDARDTGDGAKTFGYVRIKEALLWTLQGVDFFDGMVKNFEELEKDSGFQKAIKDRKEKEKLEAEGYIE